LVYRSVGTVEFLVDLERDAFYFVEMNARIQVEHPVTEAVTGFDLVAEQIAVANGQELRLQQQNIRLEGCAIECRVNAEDPAHNFRPSPGTIRSVVWPSGEGIRVDTHIGPGACIPPFYDSLIAKIIVRAADRASTIERLRLAIAETRIDGVATNLAFHAEILADPEFEKGGVDTSYVPRFLERRRVLLEA
jgi:acetyl-CoA carboxylase biotin carboxylase subunit